MLPKSYSHQTWMHWYKTVYTLLWNSLYVTMSLELNLFLLRHNRSKDFQAQNVIWDGRGPVQRGQKKGNPDVIGIEWRSYDHTMENLYVLNCYKYKIYTIEFYIIHPHPNGIWR